MTATPSIFPPDIEILSPHQNPGQYVHIPLNVTSTAANLVAPPSDDPQEVVPTNWPSVLNPPTNKDVVEESGDEEAPTNNKGEVTYEYLLDVEQNSTGDQTPTHTRPESPCPVHEVYIGMEGNIVEGLDLISESLLPWEINHPPITN